MENKQVAKVEDFTGIAVKLNASIATVLGQETVNGFEKAFLVATAIKDLKELLTPEYMAPIMQLQGSRLGFKTDKDKEGGYKVDVVKDCLIDAVLFGLQPYGNQFNIIAGQMYGTKEGIGSLLAKMKGLDYDIVAELPRIKDLNAAVAMNVTWTIAGQTKTKKLDIGIKIHASTGIDAIIGKATRKARKWLFDTIADCEIPEGDVVDTQATVMSSKINKSNEEIELDRIKIMISDCDNMDDLELLQSSNPDVDAKLFAEQKDKIKNKK